MKRLVIIVAVFMSLIPAVAAHAGTTPVGTVQTVESHLPVPPPPLCVNGGVNLIVIKPVQSSLVCEKK